MQLPPTILSLNNSKKKKQNAITAKPLGKKAPAPKTKSDSKDKSDTSQPAPHQTPGDDDHVANITDESDGEGDEIMNGDDDDLPVEDENKAETSTSGGRARPTAKKLPRGTLVPPRTLETTLFDRLEKMYGPGIKRLLNVQYR